MNISAYLKLDKVEKLVIVVSKKLKNEGKFGKVFKGFGEDLQMDVRKEDQKWQVPQLEPKGEEGKVILYEEKRAEKTHRTSLLQSESRTLAQ